MGKHSVFYVERCHGPVLDPNKLTHFNFLTVLLTLLTLLTRSPYNEAMLSNLRGVCDSDVK